MFNILKYINKPVHIQRKINQANFVIKKKISIKHEWIQLYKHLDKKGNDVKLTDNLKYKEK